MTRRTDVDAAIARRHADIPQDQLPLTFDTPSGGGDEVKTNRAPKSIRWATCPHHVPSHGRQGGLTGLVVDNHNQLVFRDHTKRVGRQTMPCPGSGEAAPDDIQETLR